MTWDRGRLTFNNDEEVPFRRRSNVKRPMSQSTVPVKVPTDSMTRSPNDTFFKNDSLCKAIGREKGQLCLTADPSWPGLLLNGQVLLARLRRAILQDSSTPGGSLRFAHRGLISFTPPACPGLSEAIPGVTATLYTNAR